MFAQGLIDEVRRLIDGGIRGGITARRAIGYAHVLSYLDGDYDLAEARERTMISTRRYVRRQRSWFRRDPRVHWLDGTRQALVGDVVRYVQLREPRQELKDT